MNSALGLLIFVSCLLSCHCQFMDEMQSFEKDCLGENKFQCMSGGCTDWENWCDGAIDCEDGSDENFCLSHKPDDVLCNVTHQFLCADKSHCLPLDWVCNNNSDCVDGSDEANCTALVIPINSTCKGFKCANDSKCISQVWVCDKRADCADGSDETLDSCRHASVSHLIHDAEYCTEILSYPEKSYRCVDSSYCLPKEYMCDGIVDCRDGSDEGEICHNWHTQCANFSCLANNSQCYPDRGGPACLCPSSVNLLRYNYSTHQCDTINDCLSDRPFCSQRCHYSNKQYHCSCDDGYDIDEFEHLCFAQGPEAMLFFSTLNEIKYYRLKSNKTVTVATGIREVHDVAFDGSYVYWIDKTKGYQSISRAHVEDVEGTKEVLISLGIEVPGNIVIDYLGGNIMFSDRERGAIFACRKDGSACRALDVKPKIPTFLTLDAYEGILYWADMKFSPVILTAPVYGRGSHEVLVDNLANHAAALALDAPNRRLYFVDRRLKAVKLDDKIVYTLLEENHHPYTLAVFEHQIYFSDWSTSYIQTLNKMYGRTIRNKLFDSQATGIFMYHPSLQRQVPHNPCGDHQCSHICLLTSNVTATCVCPNDMRLGTDSVTCEHFEVSHKQYLIIGSGSTFTRLPFETLSSLHADATSMSMGHVKAMTMDYNNTLYLYDKKRRSISYIDMEHFPLGLTHLLVYNGLRDVVDMGYDFATHSLYWLDAGFHTIGVMSMKTMERMTLYRFDDRETPISFCVIPQYGILIVAVMKDYENGELQVDSIGLNGEGRKLLIRDNLKGPKVTLRYSHTYNLVYIADEGKGTIHVMHPNVLARKLYLALPSSSVSTIALADSYVFWTDTRSSRLYWADIQENNPMIRQVEMSIFSKSTPLHLTTTLPKIVDTTSLHSHPCHNRSTCSFICVQAAHDYPTDKNYSHKYSCLCPNALKTKDNQCAKRVVCGKDQLYCYHSNVCYKNEELCDGKKDCPHGEDESGCDKLENIICGFNEMLCWGKCIDKFETCRKEETENGTDICPDTEYRCPNQFLCLDRSRLCDMEQDCLDGSDEHDCGNFSCLPSEFMCDSGMCILNSWRCDGESDCKDGTDEMNCVTKTCAVGLFQCGNGDCIDLSSRCDGQQDCIDNSDEKDCHDSDNEPSGQAECEAWEHACENNKSICLPLSSRCNGIINCPDGTDEVGCDPCSQHGLFQCKTRLNCVMRQALCDGIKQCEDGSDETAEACEKVQRQSPSVHRFAPDRADCHEGYLCATGRCLEWRQVCDHHLDCIDGTDEGMLCTKSCVNMTCAHTCRATPAGPQCACRAGFRRAADAAGCVDVDECARDACPQACFNTHGSYECACHRGYALRSDHHSCKATTGNMTVLYVNFNSVLSISMDGHNGVEYHDATVPTITDIDYDVRRRNLYIAVPSAGKLIESNTTRNSVVVTNIGMPSKVTVDWVTGNVYFVDSTPKNSWMRVCHIGRHKCARLQPLPDNTRVTAMAIDPHSRLLFYCLTVELESTVVSSTLTGESVSNVTSALNCSGLAVDSFMKKLYVAQNTGVLKISYDGTNGKTIISNGPNFESPTGLALFENHVYFLVANSYKFNRCLLYGSKRCEPFYWRLFEANTFVIKHESVQRDDVKDLCKESLCSNVCVMKGSGTACVCHSGAISSNGVCPTPDQSDTPLFDGWSSPAARVYGAVYIVLVVVLALLVVYLGIYLYYHFVIKKRRQALPYMEVRFQNVATPEQATTPVVDFSAAGGPAQEFMNPLQYVRNAWAMLNKRRPVGTAGLDINLPRASAQDLSDTESDLDAKDAQPEHSKKGRL